MDTSDKAASMSNAAGPDDAASQASSTSMGSDIEQDLGYPSNYDSKRLQKATEQLSSCLSVVRRLMCGRYEDWLYLTMLGCFMGIYSFSIDISVQSAQQFRMSSFLSTDDLASRIIIWLTLTAGAAIVSALVVASYMPSATGSGFPEIKAYLQGVKLKNVFSPLTCFGKIVFLPITLCTLLPLGKEGPVTHVAVIFALFITKVFKDISVEEMERHSGNELVAAACTMGAAVCYGAPVGGVLFTIEATRTYFAVRNYWRGFFAAVCGTLFYKAMSHAYHGTDILPMFPVLYNTSVPFNLQFIALSIGAGLICGLLGPLFVWTHAHMMSTFSALNSKSSLLRIPRLCCFSSRDKHSSPSSAFIECRVSTFRVIHTVFVCMLVSLIMLPWFSGFSPVMSHVGTRTQVIGLYSNESWTHYLSQTPPECLADKISNTTRCAQLRSDGMYQVLSTWTNNFQLDFRLVLGIYIVYFYFGPMLCTSLTLPSGTLVPILRVGAALGRLVGEMYCSMWPQQCALHSVIPGYFACMFSAALPASVTHAFSISVIVFEMTGEIVHVMSVLIAVLVANALSRHLSPSLYDSLIRAKKLPVLPKMALSVISGGYSNATAQHIMNTQLVFLRTPTTLDDIRRLVRSSCSAKVIPLVNGDQEPVGLVQVRRLRRLLREEIGHLAWQRNRLKYYVTVNAFRALDWKQLLDASAVDCLGLEIGSSNYTDQIHCPPATISDSPSTSSSSSNTSSETAGHDDVTRASTADSALGSSAVTNDAPGTSRRNGEHARNRQMEASSNGFLSPRSADVRVDAYCTVHQSDPLQSEWQSQRRSRLNLRPSVKARRSGLDLMKHPPPLSTVNEQPALTLSPLAREEGPAPPTATSTPVHQDAGRTHSRFAIRRVREDELPGASKQGQSSAHEQNSKFNSCAPERPHNASLEQSCHSPSVIDSDGVGDRVAENGEVSSSSPLQVQVSSSVASDALLRGPTNSSSSAKQRRWSSAVNGPGAPARRSHLLMQRIDSRQKLREQQHQRNNTQSASENTGLEERVSGYSLSSDVYESLVSQDSRSDRLRSSIRGMFGGRSGAADLEAASASTSDHVTCCDSAHPDCSLKNKTESTSNLNTLLQKTIRRTSVLLTAMKNGSPEDGEDARLRREWRRDCLRREIHVPQAIVVDAFPLSVNIDTSIAQVHKMFHMLCANKLYVIKYRTLVGYISLRQFAEFITRGRVEDTNSVSDDTSPGQGDGSSGSATTAHATIAHATTAHARQPASEKFGSQDTLQDLDDGVYDTIYEPGGVAPVEPGHHLQHLLSRPSGVRANARNIA